MNSALMIEKMSIEEKMYLMESLWDDLCKRSELIEPPAWHKDILEERELEVSSGKQVFTDWETSKKNIMDKVVEG